MQINTNDMNVAIWGIAWEICKDINPERGMKDKSYKPASEEFALKQAETVNAVYKKLCS